MNNYINSLNIGQYRGIKSLVINNLNNINVIVGDNNTGKTSLLETIYLLRAPHSFNNVLRSSRLRTSLTINSASPYESFISMFPKDNQDLSINIQVESDFRYYSIEIVGRETTTIIDDDDLRNYPSAFRHVQEKKLLGTETSVFVGEMKSMVNSNIKETQIRFTSISRNTFYGGTANDGINVEYLSPISHITENTFNSIVRKEDYKEICIELIRLFDPDIEDLLYMRNNSTGRAVEYVKSSRSGLMPLSSYGDGIKKVLSLANGILEAAGGILLIDEIDTSIHYRYYEDIFSFLIKASAAFNVQIFITTHSQEAIDEILKTQNYEENRDGEHDPINVITLRKDEYGGIRSRSMSGFEVYTNRELFDFEVRL